MGFVRVARVRLLGCVCVCVCVCVRACVCGPPGPPPVTLPVGFRSLLGGIWSALPGPATLPYGWFVTREWHPLFR